MRIIAEIASTYHAWRGIKTRERAHAGRTRIPQIDDAENRPVDMGMYRPYR